MDTFRIGDLVTVRGEGLCIIVGIEQSAPVPDHLKDVIQNVYYVLSSSHLYATPRFASELRIV